MKHVFKKNLLLIIIFQILYFFLLFLKRYFFPSEIFFYESLNLLLILSIFLFLILIIKKKSYFNMEHIYILVTSFLLSYAILITFPTLSKRSISLFMLMKINNVDEKGISKNELESSVVKEFFIENKEVERRINEQLDSKNITLKNDKFFILSKGKKINHINNLLIKIFNLD